MKTREKSQRDLWNTINPTKIYIMEIPKNKRERTRNIIGRTSGPELPKSEATDGHTASRTSKNSN